MYGGLILVSMFNMDWWFKVLNLDIFYQYDSKINLFGVDFNYCEELKKFDVEVLKCDLKVLMINS